MISSDDLGPGMTIQRDGEIFVVLEQSQNKITCLAMATRAKIRNLRTGSNVELPRGDDDKIVPTHIEKKEMQCLYDTGDVLVFADNETYEQIEIPKDHLRWETNFTRPNDNVDISMFESEVPGVILPDKMALQVVECEPAVKGDTAISTSKNATLEPGLKIRVSLFIDQDEMVLVNTSDEKYSGRAKD